MQSLELRVAQLEVQNRRLRRVQTIVLVGLVLIVGAGMAAVDDVVRAKRFEVLNDEGKVVWFAGSVDGGGQTIVNSPQGQVAWSARGTAKGGIALVADESGKAGWQVQSDDHGGMMVIGNSKQKTVLAMGANESGGVVSIMNNDSDIVSQLGVEDSQGGKLVLRNSYKDLVVSLASIDHQGTLILSNSVPKRGFIAKATSAGGEFAVLSDDGNTPLLAAMSNGFGGLLEIANKESKAVVRLGTDAASEGTINVHNKTGLEVGRFFSDTNGSGGRLDLRGSDGVAHTQLWNDNGRGTVYTRK